MPTLSPAALKVQAALRQHGLDLQVVELAESTRTALEAAQVVGCELGQIVKSLVFRTKKTERPVLVLASGANRVDEKRLAELVGEKIGKADPDFVRQQTGFAIGGVPPLAHPQPLLTFIDQDLLQYATIWAAAGTPFAVFQLTPPQLLAVTGGAVTRITS